MNCKFFGKCGSCTWYEGGYEGQLERKIAKVAPLFQKEPEIFPSPHSHYRARGEFGIWHEGEEIFYTMYGLQERRIKIDSCPMMLKPISDLFSPLKEAIAQEETLSHKLFRIDFLSSLKGEVLVSLIYHRPLDEEWERRARELAKNFAIQIVGRSRGQKVVVGRDFIYEELPIGRKKMVYLHYEGSFTQPNPFVNTQMITWALRKSRDFGGDLLELYCGAGNFTLALSQNFEKVLATEISKSSIKAAKEAMRLNGIENITFVRMSSEEFTQALERKREFRRLKDIDLQNYNFSTIFVDPPRAGLDEGTRKLASRFENIIYISCNPSTLARDIEALRKSHKIKDLAFFDQFPYTPHLESGVVLQRV